MTGDSPAPESFSGVELTAENPVEFRRLLKQIRAVSGLSCGQISVKTGIPRSQAYNMVSSRRTSLPRNPEQVRAFLIACGCPQLQVEATIEVWRRLSEQLAKKSPESVPNHLKQAIPANGVIDHINWCVGNDEPTSEIDRKPHTGFCAIFTDRTRLPAIR